LSQREVYPKSALAAQERHADQAGTEEGDDGGTVGDLTGVNIQSGVDEQHTRPPLVDLRGVGKGSVLLQANQCGAHDVAIDHELPNERSTGTKELRIETDRKLFRSHQVVERERCESVGDGFGCWIESLS